MNKTLIRLLALMCLLSVLLFALPASAEGTASVDIDSLFRQAEDILALPYKDVPVINKNHPLPDGVRLTGPFLYVAREDVEEAMFIPDAYWGDYVPSGLPEGAKLCVTEDSVIARLYSGIIDGSADAPIVYAVLFGVGYGRANNYQGGLTVYDHHFEALFVDYATGEIIARSDGADHGSGPYTVRSNEYYRDMNGRNVYYRDNSSLVNNIWRDMLLYASADSSGAVIQSGELITLNNKNLTEYTVPDGVTAIASRAFLGCELLESVVLPEGLISIGSNAFDGCSALRDIVFPSTLELIEYGALDATAWYAERLNEQFLIVGDGLLLRASISEDDRSSVSEAFLEEIIEAYGEPDSWDSETEEMIAAMLAEENGDSGATTELVMPEGVKRLMPGSCANINVWRLALPGTLEGRWANDECFPNASIHEIYLSDGIKELPYGVFALCEGLNRVRLPASIVTFSDFVWGEAKENITVVCEENSSIYRTLQDFGYRVEAE